MADLQIGKGVELPLSVVTSKAAILAMTGMGKTYLARVMAEEMLKQRVQIVVADYTGVWWGLQSSASGKREGFPVVIFGGEHADVPINEDAGKLIADVVVNERISAILDTTSFEDDAPKIRFMNAFARRLYFANKRPVHLFIDEADEWVPQTPQRDQIHLFSIIKRIWQRGRVKGIGGTLISQRSALVNKSLLSQSEMLIALRTVSPQDRAALKAWFDSWGSEKEIETFTKTISNLPDHHAWFWSPKHKLFVHSRARQLETFDSGATPDIEHEISGPERRTKIDVDKLGKQIAKLAEDAKADDPEILKKQLAHYKEQFEHAKNRYVLLEQRLANREKRKPVEVAKPVKVPYLSPKTLQGVRTAVRSLQKARTELANLVVDVQGAGGKLQDNLTKAAEMFEQSRALVAAAKTTEKKGEIISERLVRETKAFGSEFSKPSSNGTGKTGNIKGARGAILRVLAQYGPTTWKRARVLAGIESLDTMTTYVREHQRKGWIARQGDTLTITVSGISALGEYDPLPTGAALVEHWKRQLGAGGLGDIFRAMIVNAGRTLQPHEIMSAADIRSEDTFITYVRKLAARGLVEKDGSGYRAASDFEGL